jgi:hypothetical protein
MSLDLRSGNDENTDFSPFSLKWAEQAPAELLWTHRSLFSPTINGLELHQATETDNPETTGPKSDSTGTQVF